MRISVDASRARATMNVLRKLPRDLRRRVADALRAELRQVIRDAKAILRDPSSTPRSRSGHTARNIRLRSRNSGLTQLAEVKAHPQKGPVALFLEAGTSRGGRRETRTRLSTRRRRGGITELVRRRSSARVGGSEHSPAYPFLTLALERRQATIERNLAKEIRDVLEDASRQSAL